MQRSRDVGVHFPGMLLVHHNLPGKRVGWHGWNQAGVFIPLEGDLTVELESGPLRASPGRLVFVPPGMRMRFESSKEAGERLICLVEAATWSPVASNAHPPTCCPTPPICREILFHLLSNRRSEAATSLVLTFLQALSDSIRSHRRPDLFDLDTLRGRIRDSRIRAAIDHMSRELHSTLRMSQVAKVAGLSTRNMSRLFVEELGRPPAEVLTHLRVALARDLLLTGLPSSDAARRCGYQSYPSFLAVFRKLHGRLPSEYARFGRILEETGSDANVSRGAVAIERSGQPTAAPQIRTETTMTIEQILKQYEKALNANDTSTILGLYGTDPIFMPQHSKALVGRDAVRSGYEHVFATIKLNIEFTIYEVHETEQWAWARTSSAGRTRILANGVEIEEGNNELFVFRKEEGTWKIHRYLFSTTTPMGV